MITRRAYRKPDTLIVVLLLVIIGVSVAIVYQLRMYDADGQLIVRNYQKITSLPWKVAPPEGATATFDLSVR